MSVVTSKVAIITGASSGIGRVTAVSLSAAGWKVALAARRHDSLAETAKLCTGPTHIVVGDVADEACVIQLFGETIKEFEYTVPPSHEGRLDLVFNNAGTGAPQIPMEELSLAAFQKVINVNLTGSFLCTREAFKVFKRQSPPGGTRIRINPFAGGKYNADQTSGRIINNGSISAHTPRPHTSPYTASKHALTGLTKSTALDGRAHDITCTQIDIGNAYTDMAAGLAVGAMQPNGEVLPETTFDPQHVADAIVHIASLPNSVTVLQINIMSTGMPFVGRG